MFALGAGQCGSVKFVPEPTATPRKLKPLLEPMEAELGCEGDERAADEQGVVFGESLSRGLRLLIWCGGD